MMNAVKKYFLREYNKIVVKKYRNNVRETLNYSDAKNIGVLFFTRNEDMHVSINQLFNKINKDNKNFRALTFHDDVRRNLYHFDYTFFKIDEVSLFGKIKSEHVEHFINIEFDYLFCITLEEDIDTFDQILVRSKAKCRVGNFREDKSHLYECMIRLKSGEEIDKLIHQMLKYTQAICHN